MKMTKKVLSVLLSLMLVLGAVAVCGMTASAAEEYDLWVGGVRVTSENKSGDGWSYEGDGTSGTLTLVNATITGSYSNARIMSSVSNLTIVLIGDNLIPNEGGSGIFYNNVGKLTITGNGTLDVSGSAYSIYSSGTLTIEDASVVAKSDGAYSINSKGYIAIENATVISNSNGYYSIYSDAALTITNSYVSAESTGACIFAHPLVLGEGLGITEPVGGQNSGKMITLNGQDVQKAVIQPAYSVELSANPSGGGTVSGAGSYAKDGATATVTATPNTGYHFVNWTENGEEVSTDAEYSFTVSGNRELVANFELDTHSVSVTANPTEGGTVTGGGTYNYGGSATVTATPNQHYHFVNWTENGEEVSTDAEYTFTVDKDRNLTANFELDTHSVSVTANPTEGGTVTGGGTYNYGGSATVTATPNENYRFVNWTENGDEVSTDAEYSFTVTGDRELVANFERVYTVKFVNEDGTELQSSSVAYGKTPIYEGDTPTKGSTPEYSYTFASWSPEIAEVTGDATYTATYIQTPVDYKLTWVIDDENYKNETIPFGSNVSAPEVDEKEGYTFAWVDEIPATMPAENVTINGEYTAIKYTATFVKEDGTELETREYDVETTSIDEPAVPEKQGYDGRWEEYTLKIGGITVKPVYDNITSIAIKDFEENSETGYKEDKTFTVEAKDLPEGAEIHWFVNGEDVGTGESYTVEDPTEDYNIYAAVVDADGNTLDETQVQAVKVRNGFLDKLKWFFSNLLKNFLDAIFGDFGKIC